MNNFKNNHRRSRFKPNGDKILEKEMEMAIKIMVILIPSDFVRKNPGRNN